MGCAHSHKSVERDDVYRKYEPVMNGSIKQNGNVGDDTFSEHHKDILRETWQTISQERQEKGVAIFVQIFDECPQAKSYFPFRDLNGEELLQNVMFRSHALRFINAIDTTIQSLDALEVALIPVLHHLGKQHASIAGFLPDYLPVFMRAILHVCKEEVGKGFTNEIEQAWEALAKFIAVRMIEGYNQAQLIHNSEDQEDSVHKASENEQATVLNQSGNQEVAFLGLNGHHGNGTLHHTADADGIMLETSEQIP